MTFRDSDRYHSYDVGGPRRILPVEPSVRSSLVVRALRAFSGSVVAGVVILCLVVIASASLGHDRGFPGPGSISIIVHVLASVVVIAVQRVADRREGLVAVVASVVVIAVATLLLWTQWWG